MRTRSLVDAIEKINRFHAAIMAQNEPFWTMKSNNMEIAYLALVEEQASIYGVSFEQLEGWCRDER